MKTSTKIYLLFVFLLVLTGTISAQIGINTLQPDPNAVLDIQSADKGIKLPDIKDPSVMNPPADSSGYLIYHSTSKKFRYWNNQEWETVNPLSVDKDENVTAPGNLKISGANIYAPNADSISARKATVRADNFVGHGITPIGGIIMWKGPINGNFDANGNGLGSLDGWAICDGNNGTPDLKGKFIAGYSGSGDYTSIGVGPGGADHTTLTVDNLPTHSHGITDPGHNHANGSYKNLLQYNGNGTVGSPDNSNGEPDLLSKGEILPSQTGVTVNYTGGVYYAEQSHTDLTGSPLKMLPKASCLAFQECISSCNGDVNCISTCNNVYNSICGNPQYNPNYGQKVIDSPEHWDVQPFDNRPAYYVLAFIMRVK